MWHPKIKHRIHEKNARADIYNENGKGREAVGPTKIPQRGCRTGSKLKSVEANRGGVYKSREGVKNTRNLNKMANTKNK